MMEKITEETDMMHRHLSILKLVFIHEPIGIVKLSSETGWSHHKVRYSLRVLEEESLIEATQQGATTTERANEFLINFNDDVDHLIERVEGMKIPATGP